MLLLVLGVLAEQCLKRWASADESHRGDNRKAKLVTLASNRTSTLMAELHEHCAIILPKARLTCPATEGTNLLEIKVTIFDGLRRSPGSQRLHYP